MKRLVRAFTAMLFMCLGFEFLPTIAMARDAHLSSLEWLVATSDAIVRGRVSEFTPGRRNTVVERGWSQATVQVAETLKGPEAHELTICIPDADDRQAADWRDENVELLLFLVQSERIRTRPTTPAPCEFSLHRGLLWGWSAVRLDGKPIWKSRGPESAVRDNGKSVRDSRTPDKDLVLRTGVWTMDFQHLTDREDILAAVRQEVAQTPDDQADFYRLELPVSAYATPEQSRGGRINLIAPLDRRLERLARERAMSENPWDRMEAVRILSHFRSDENIALLGWLLADPYCRVEFWQGVKRRVYPVRKEAYEALGQWKIEIQAPLIEERLDRGKT